jgi:hypothetical protein
MADELDKPVDGLFHPSACLKTWCHIAIGNRIP